MQTKDCKNPFHRSPTEEVAPREKMRCAVAVQTHMQGTYISWCMKMQFHETERNQLIPRQVHFHVTCIPASDTVSPNLPEIYPVN